MTDTPRKCPVTHLTTDFGAPVPSNRDSLTAGPRGPLLAQDVWLNEKLANFVREVIPERRMHAKGSGAFGTFTVTHDITRYTRAQLFDKVGKQTELFARFTTVAGERGAADAERDIRGFALKFYTEEGNWDLVGNNTPVFFIRDPRQFPDLNKAVKRDPKTNLRSKRNNWDWWTLIPEALRACGHEPFVLALRANMRHAGALRIERIARGVRAADGGICTALRAVGTLLLFVCRKWRGTPVAQHASALRWVRPVELHGLAMPPADKPLIGLLEALGVRHALAVQYAPLLAIGIGLIGFLTYGPDTLMTGAGAQDEGSQRGAATAAGIINGVGSMGQMLSGYIVATVKSTYGWDALFYLLVFFAFLSGALLSVKWNYVPVGEGGRGK